MTQRRAIAPRSLAASVALALTGGLLAAPTAAWASSTAQQPSAQSPAKTMFCTAPGQELAISDPSALTKGQPVTWKTTTSGTTPETLQGEYVGKLTNGLGNDANGKPRDLLLVKLDGPVVNGESKTLPAGVWAGASGSPVYDADGALIGAVSYGFSDVADIVAGVTPAAAMKGIGDLPSSVKLNAPAKRSLAKAATTSTESVGSTAKRLKLARVTSGASAARLDAVSEGLAKKSDGRHKAVGAGGVATNDSVQNNPDLKAPLVAGGNIAVTLASGDVTDGSIGTVTAVCGQDVWAFGHPNNFDSTMVSAMHNASAARIVPSAGASYKQVDEIGPAQGIITEDRYAGIKGSLGTVSSIPVTIKSTVGGHTTKSAANVTERYDLAPTTGALLAAEAQRVLDNGVLGSVKVTWSIDYKRGTSEKAKTETLHKTDRFAAIEEFPDSLAEVGPASDVAAIVSNEFQDVRVTAVRMQATFSPGYEATRISGVQQKVKGAWKTIKSNSTVTGVAGSSSAFRAVMNPAPDASNATEYVPFNVYIPKGAKSRMSVDLGAAGGSDDDDIWAILAGSDSDDEIAEPRNLTELIAALTSATRADQLAITRTYTGSKPEPVTLTNLKTTGHVIAGGDFSWKFSVKQPAPKKITAGTVKIKGTAKVGRKLTATKAGWKPGGLRYSYQWLSNGKSIKNAKHAAYTITKGYAGKKLSVKVTAKKSGYKTTSKTSATTKAVAK
jgi:hypothetical protein